MDELLSRLISRTGAFKQEAHSILSIHEASVSRIVLLENTYSKLSGLSIRQDELFRQALRCTESGLFRAAHVMAWAGFVDFLQEKMASDGFKTLSRVRPKWNISTVEELREKFTEYQQVEACQVMGLCKKGETKVLLGLLNKRHECAHPSDYFPGLNETLGYISELLQRVEMLQNKSL